VPLLEGVAKIVWVRCAHHLSVGEGHCRAFPQGASHPCRLGLCGGDPLRTTLFSAFSLPCEIVSISQDRPCSASEHTRSVERKQGKGLVTGFPGGVPHSQESFCMTNYACTHRAEKGVFGRGALTQPPSLRRRGVSPGLPWRCGERLWPS
jgi:hypothetical protein